MTNHNFQPASRHTTTQNHTWLSHPHISLQLHDYSDGETLDFSPMNGLHNSNIQYVAMVSCATTDSDGEEVDIEIGLTRLQLIDLLTFAYNILKAVPERDDHDARS